MEYKKCSECHKNKNLNEFYSRKSKSKKKGEYIYYHPECKTCTKKRSYEWYSDNKEHYEAVIRKKYNQTDKFKKAEAASAIRHKGYRRKYRQINKSKMVAYRMNREHKKHDITEAEWLACKEYFNYCCAYCAMTEECSLIENKQQLHKDHAINEGENDISNCLPSCRSCNSSKKQNDWDNWFNEENKRFSIERYLRISHWLSYMKQQKTFKKVE